MPKQTVRTCCRYFDGGDGVIVHFEDTGPEQPEEIIACSVRILGGILLS